MRGRDENDGITGSAGIERAGLEKGAGSGLFFFRDRGISPSGHICSVLTYAHDHKSRK